MYPRKREYMKDSDKSSFSKAVRPLRWASSGPHFCAQYPLGGKLRPFPYQGGGLGRTV